MNSSTIVSRIHHTSTNGQTKMFQLLKKAIERLKQGESINVQDLETNLYWEFGKFTSRDDPISIHNFIKMSNTNNTMQTQTSNALRNAIMEAGGKDRPPMLAPDNYNPPYEYKWNDKVVPVTEGRSKTTIERYMENYKNVSQDIRDQLNAEAEAVQIILTGIDNDIYSTVDACPNACEMWKAIERFYKMMNELVRNQCDVTNHQVNIQFLLQLQPEWKRFVTLVKQSKELKTVSYHKLYDILKQHQNEVNEIRAKRLAQIDKLMALISLSFKKIYKPTNNNLRTSSNTSRANQDNSPSINRGTRYDNQRIVNVAGARETIGTTVVQKSRIQCYNYKEYEHVPRECQKLKRVKDAAYHKEKILLCKQEEAGFQLNAEQADWKDNTDDEHEDQELEAHYMYMAQIQEVNPDATDNSGPIFDSEPLQKVSMNDNYNVFAIESKHLEQSKSVNDTYLIEQDEHNVTIDLLDMSYDREQVDQDDDDDLANERDLLASLFEKLKCEIDDSKNRNKFLETSNKVLVDKLKDLKKFQVELHRYHDVKYASKVEIVCAKEKGDLMSYKMEFEKSSNEYTQKIDDLNQTIFEMKKELFAHQETIFIMTQQKEAQIKFYKTHEDKEIDKVIALENKLRINADLEKFHLCLKEERVADLRYFNSLELDVDSLKSQLETQKTQFLNEIDRLSKEYYYADHMNAILGVYTESDEVTNLQCIRQPNAFKSQRPSILGKPTIFLDSLEKQDCSKSKSVTKNSVSNDFSKPVTAQILPPNNKSIKKNTNVIAP
nr:hypothetical protein [Tanacetum cinerariifolium]